MFKKTVFYFFSLVALLTSFSCADSPELDDKVIDNFDRKLMLENITDNIILPAFDDFSEKIEELELSVITFSNDLDLASLEQVQSHWVRSI